MYNENGKRHRRDEREEEEEEEEVHKLKTTTDLLISERQKRNINMHKAHGTKLCGPTPGARMCARTHRARHCCRAKTIRARYGQRPSERSTREESNIWSEQQLKRTHTHTQAESIPRFKRHCAPSSTFLRCCSFCTN